MKRFRFKEVISSQHLFQLKYFLILIIISPAISNGYSIQQSPTGSIKSHILPTGSNVEVNANNANPIGEPLHYQIPITNGQTSSQVIETVVIRKGNNYRNKPKQFKQFHNPQPFNRPISYQPNQIKPQPFRYPVPFQPNNNQAYPPQFQVKRPVEMYNTYAGGAMIQQMQYFPKENAPLPPFRSIRTLPGGTFIPVRGIDGSMRYAVEPNPLEPTPISPVYSSPPTTTSQSTISIPIQQTQSKNRQVVAYRQIHPGTLYSQSNSGYATSTKLRMDQLNGFLGPNPKAMNNHSNEFLIPYQYQQQLGPTTNKQSSNSRNQNNTRIGYRSIPQNTPSYPQPPPRYGEYSTSKRLNTIYGGNPLLANQYSINGVQPGASYYPSISGGGVPFGQQSDIRDQWTTEAVRKAQVNIQSTPYPYNISSPAQDKMIYYSQNIFPQTKGHRFKTSKAGIPFAVGRATNQDMEWQYQQQQQQNRPPSPFLQQQPPLSTKSSGLGPRAYSYHEPNGSNPTGQAYINQVQQKEAQKFNNNNQWQTLQGQTATPKGQQGQDSREFWAQPQPVGSFRSSSRNPPSVPQARNFRRLEANPSNHAGYATAGYSRSQLDKPISPSRNNFLQQYEWQNGNSPFSGASNGSNYAHINSVTVEGHNNPYAQLSTYVKLNETAVSSLGSQPSVQQQKGDERKSTPDTKKAEAPILPVSRGEMQISSQPQIDLNDRRLHANNETKEDHKLESDSAILQQYLQRAKQVLREHKEKQSSQSDHNNAVLNNIPNTGGNIIVPKSPVLPTTDRTYGSKSRSTSPSQSPPASPRGSNGPIDGPVSSDAVLQLHKQSDGPTSTINREASPPRDSDRTDASSAVQQQSVPAVPSAGGSREPTQLSPNSAVLREFIDASEYAAVDREPVPKHARLSRHIQSTRQLRFYKRPDY